MRKLIYRLLRRCPGTGGRHRYVMDAVFAGLRADDYASERCVGCPRTRTRSIRLR